ncbi:MarR family winged helix-turn-helix transcriptional regulator [Edaphobacillus lindanitolerans]|uniref:DNA-binding transcriptional regulator, MarR family n=1 Tax=Edaphobacillus lindanitolerans TaxID=550447 RepID=A0A1U7PMT3_9BACI|nr:MarR family transcriptional regulator [Edaphobacillus lindanitolerans]SIT71498.1 DNA-binding transcriptional regulator, MarR family [Edaphobacillus lindanitolerans]
MQEKLREAIGLFEEVMIYGAEHVLRSVDVDIWREYSPEQIQALKILSASGPMSNGQLASMQGVHKSAVSSRLKKLEEKGLVSSVRDPADQRAKLIAVTGIGLELLRKSDTAIYESVEGLFNDEISEEELDAFIHTFRKLKDILRFKEL